MKRGRGLIGNAKLSSKNIGVGSGPTLKFLTLISRSRTNQNKTQFQLKQCFRNYQSVKLSKMLQNCKFLELFFVQLYFHAGGWSLRSR